MVICVLDSYQQTGCFESKYTHSDRIRFIKKTLRVKNGCWIWIACKDDDGYGVFSFDGKTLRAPRVSYEIYYQVVLKPGENVCHTCDNPNCVNPAHLWIGSSQDNSDDMKRKKRSCVGEKNGNAKLSWEKVLKIRELYFHRKIKIIQLAREFDISPIQIWRIVNFRVWNLSPLI
jgi:hypothetical protein